MGNEIDYSYLRQLAQLKKEDAEAYKEAIADIKSVFKDFILMQKELMEELAWAKLTQYV